MTQIISIAAGAVLIAVLITLFFYAHTPPIESEDGIAELRKIDLGGIKQWILIRGEDTTLPILLFLHGGAGTPEMGLVRRYNQDLEKHFLVVNWDQRAAGKSCTPEARASELSIKRFVQDTLELTKYLRRTFNQEKIYLLGHSWGSVIGMMAIHERPEYYHAYIGTGQMSDIPRQEQVGYQLLLDLVRREGIEKAIQELTDIGAPDVSGRYRDGMKGTSIQRKWLTKMGGFFYKESSMLPKMVELFASPEYSGLDCCRFIQGMFLPKKNSMMEDEFFKTDLTRMVKEVEVPVFFFLGRHDLNASSAVSAQYLEKLEAPMKQLVWFDRSAHSPCFEEAETFNQELISVKSTVKPGSKGGGGLD